MNGTPLRISQGLGEAGRRVGVGEVGRRVVQMFASDSRVLMETLCVVGFRQSSSEAAGFVVLRLPNNAARLLKAAGLAETSSCLFALLSQLRAADFVLGGFLRI